VAGASAEQILQGFLQATLAGGSDGFKVARAYLTETAAEGWDPTAEVAVYPSGEAPVLAPAAGENQFTLSFLQVGQLSSDGRYSTMPGEKQRVEFTLVQEPAGWRVDRLPDAVVVPQDVFLNDYVRTVVFFPAAEGQVMVPDVHYFLRNLAATAAVQTLLDVPPDYLGPAVSAPNAAKARLVTDAVRVDAGRATVNLSAEVRRATETERATLAACLVSSLTSIGSVNTVELQVESAPFDAPESKLVVDPLAAEGPYYLGDGGLWRMSGEAARVPGFEATDGWETLSVDSSGARLAALRGGQLEYIGGPGMPAVSWPVEGTPTSSPVFDTAGRLWLGVAGSVVVYSLEGKASRLQAPWLAERQVVGLAPARDGARLAVLSAASAGGPARLDVAGIERVEGAPTGLAGPLKVASFTGAARSMAWQDHITLALLAPSDNGGQAVQLVTLGSTVQELNAPLDKPTSLTAGRGSEGLYITGEAGGLFHYAPLGAVWTAVATGARSVTYRS